MELDFRAEPLLLRDIVDMVAVGVFTVDAQARFVAWNRGAERITGFSAEEVRGQPCQLLEGPNCKGFASLAEMLRSPSQPPEGICNQQCKLLSKDGHERHIHGSVQVLRDPQGQIAGAVGTFMDVTSLVLANEKIAVLSRQSATSFAFEQLIGQSAAMREVYRQLNLAADSDVTVLITGESGTGKELAARAIHARSDRRQHPLLAINCAAIPDALLESELFGHVKGAFTGATSDKLGLFEAASGGTLFLDEIGEVSPAIQVKLLRVLQEREIRRVGDSRTRKVDVRLVTATNQDLQRRVADGAMREDFLYRINVFQIRMPPLRERREDIPLLVEHLVPELSRSARHTVDGVARDAMDALRQYDWPGNVRQLRNALEYACVHARGDRISLLDLPADMRGHGGPPAPDASQPWSEEEAAERERIVDALRQTGGNRTRAAQLLGTSRVTLWKKMGRYGIDVPG
jgi:PAS domain S-box-containing protein